MYPSNVQHSASILSINQDTDVITGHTYIKITFKYKIYALCMKSVVDHVLLKDKGVGVGWGGRKKKRGIPQEEIWRFLI